MVAERPAGTVLLTEPVDKQEEFIEKLCTTGIKGARLFCLYLSKTALQLLVSPSAYHVMCQ